MDSNVYLKNEQEYLRKAINTGVFAEGNEPHNIQRHKIFDISALQMDQEGTSSPPSTNKEVQIYMNTG